MSYLEGCTAPMRDTNQLHAAVVELIALEGAEIKYSTVQNWYPGDKEGKGGIYNFVTKRGKAGAERKDFVDAGGDGFVDHVEVSERDFAGGQFGGGILLGGADESPAAGGHGDEDGAYRQEHAEHDRVQGDFGGGAARTATGGR